MALKVFVVSRGGSFQEYKPGIGAFEFVNGIPLEISDFVKDGRVVHTAMEIAESLVRDRKDGSLAIKTVGDYKESEEKVEEVIENAPSDDEIKAGREKRLEAVREKLKNKKY